MARVLLLVAPVLVLLAEVAAAQLHRATDGVLTPPSALVLQDDASAIDVNPSAIGLLPTFSLTYVHAEVNEAGSFLGRGDAVSFSTPLLFGLSTGLTLQSIRPDDLAARGGTAAADRALAGLALAFAPGKRWSAGVGGRVLSSGDDRFDALSAVDLGLAWHASDSLGFALVGRDLFASREGFGTAGLDLGSSLLVSAQLRPAGSSDLALDFTVAVDDRGTTAGRGGLGLAVPGVGYASCVAELDDMGGRDEALRVLAGLDLNLEGVTVGGGGVAGERFDGGAGYFVALRAQGRPREGLAARRRVVDLELSGVDERSMIEHARALDAALHDERVAGVVLRPRGSGIGSAYAQELRLLIASLRGAGKRVVCHLEEASAAEYYACANADAVLIDPAGSVRLLGSGSDVLLFGETLRKLGVRADFLRIGAYKSAPEQLTQGELSEPAREELRVLLHDVHLRQLSDLARDLRVPAPRVAELMDAGPHLAAQAVADKLVAQSFDEGGLARGELPLLADYALVDEVRPYARTDWYAGPRVGVVVIDGAIVDGESVDLPFLGVHMSGGRTVVQAIDAMAADPLVRSIVLRVDSPGGAVLASDQIWRAVRRARERKPVITSMGAVAASGGYYVASAANEIWADPSTLTGSIGIFYGKVDVEQLAGKLGVGIETFRRGKRAGAESPFRPFTPDERAALTERLREYYRMFLARVAEGRRKTPVEIDAHARGRVFSGDAALRVGLVDRLGGFASALARARELGHVGDDAELRIVPTRPRQLLDYLTGGGDARAGASLRELVPQALRSALARWLVLQRLSGDAPLALLPYDLRL